MNKLQKIITAILSVLFVGWMILLPLTIISVISVAVFAAYVFVRFVV